MLSKDCQTLSQVAKPQLCLVSQTPACLFCQLGQNHFPFPPKQSVEELKESTDVHNKLLVCRRADTSPQQPDSSTDGSSVLLLTFTQYKRKGTNSLYNYPIIAYCHTTKNWRVRITIIWNQQSIFQLFPENCCTNIKKRTNCTVKLKKPIPWQESKSKCLVILFDLLGNIRKTSPETLAQVSDTVEGYLRIILGMFLLRMMGINRYSSFNWKIINLVAMLLNVFSIQIITSMLHDENVTNQHSWPWSLNPTSRVIYEEMEDKQQWLFWGVISMEDVYVKAVCSL